MSPIDVIDAMRPSLFENQPIVADRELAPPSPLGDAVTFSSRAASASSLVIIDPTVSNYQTLVAGVKADTEVVVLNSTQDAIAQITDILLQREGISSLHIVSHGSKGSLDFASGSLNAATLGRYAADLRQWGRALTPNADVLFYGCDIAIDYRSPIGVSVPFLRQIASLTGADVAASNDLTGTAALGGDWDLEITVGSIESGLAFESMTLAEYVGTLVAPVVTLPGGALAYSENGAALPIGSTATISDVDSADFAGGTLTISLTSGAIASDRLEIQSQGGITRDGRRILFNGTEIGTFTGGIGAQALTISLNAQATAANTQTLLQNITYANVSQLLPTTANRTVQVVLADGDGDTSTAVTRSVTVAGSNDAPSLGTSVTLYDGTLGTLPSSQGFDFFSIPLSSQDLDGNSTILSSNQNAGALAGYFKNVQTILDDTAGYVVSFTVQVLSEARAETADKNGDGIDDRAGFSVIVLSNDPSKAIELGFWQDRIWAQNDGTSQTNPSLEPDDDPITPTRTLFTQGESVNFNTTGLTAYDLAVINGGYTLYANGTAILSGRMRDYQAFDKPPNPYRTANLLFLGDNTPSAAGQVRLSNVSVTTATPLAPQTVAENTPLVVRDLRVGDVEAQQNPITTTLTVANGTLTVSNAVANGVSGTGITGNGTGTLTLTATPGQINATLANGLTYQGRSGFNGSDSLSVVVNDQGQLGGAAQTANQTVAITVTGVNDAPVNTMPVAQTILQDTSLVFSGDRVISVSDPDVGSGALQITLTATNGTLSLNGTSGLSFVVGNGTNNDTMTFTGTQANVNTALNGLNFNPTLGFSGAASVQIITNDQGNTGGTALTDTDSVSITVASSANVAPVLLDTNVVLNPIAEDAPAPTGAVGTLVSQLVDLEGGGGQNNVTDSNLGAIAGMAIVNADSSNGTWYVGTGNPTVTWTTLGAVAVNNARLLTAQDRLYFQPNANYNGTATVTFRAWDQTVGSSGQFFTTTLNGGASAFSTATDTATVTVTPINDAPVLTLSTNILNYPKGTTARVIDGTATVTDIDSADFNTGTLTVQLTANGTADDRLAVRNEGTASGQIGVSGNTITFGGVQIGTYAGGVGTAPLTITLNASATVPAVQALLRNITFGNVSADPSTAARTVQFTLTDGDTGTSSPLTKTINIVNRSNQTDFNNDGQIDFAWHNIETNGTGFWLMNGSSIASLAALPAPPSTDWRIVGIADFNGDGNSDLYWRNIVTGNNGVWLMNGTSIASVFALSAVDPSWVIGGVGDFNGDGNPDIVWRNPSTGTGGIWLMNGTSIQSVVSLPEFTSSAWVVQGVGDFNGDGQTDIVWRNFDTGANALWLMNGTSYSSAILFAAPVDPVWEIAGVGDFDNDGQNDLFWRSYDGSGANGIWLMNGTSVRSVVGVAAVPGDSWVLSI